jgi:hypothetical protein
MNEKLVLKGAMAKMPHPPHLEKGEAGESGPQVKMQCKTTARKPEK